MEFSAFKLTEPFVKFGRRQQSSRVRWIRSRLPTRVFTPVRHLPNVRLVITDKLRMRIGRFGDEPKSKNDSAIVRVEPPG